MKTRLPYREIVREKPQSVPERIASLSIAKLILKVNMPAQPELLIGKYFIAPFPHWDGRVEALINDGHYLVRFDVGSDGSPEALAVVALSDMVRAGRENEEEGLAHWLFFDTVEQRARFRAWLDAPEDPNKPRVVPMRRQ
jgi:hypothetical protein